MFFTCGGVLEGFGGRGGGLVFGTLLGPEATGPGFSRVCLFLVSWLHRSHGLVPFFGGLVCGVCGTGLLFENYIVDASIFYKKQFPRIMNLDLAARDGTAPGGWCCWVWLVSVVFSKITP